MAYLLFREVELSLEMHEIRSRIRELHVKLRLARYVDIAARFDVSSYFQGSSPSSQGGTRIGEARSTGSRIRALNSSYPGTWTSPPALTLVLTFMAYLLSREAGNGVAQTIFPVFLLVNKCSKNSSKGAGADGLAGYRKDFLLAARERRWDSLNGSFGCYLMRNE